LDKNEASQGVVYKASGKNETFIKESHNGFWSFQQIL